MTRPPIGERGRCKVEAVGRKRKSHAQSNGGFSFIFTFPQESVFTCSKIVYVESIYAKLKSKQSIKQLDKRVARLNCFFFFSAFNLEYLIHVHVKVFKNLH